MTISETLDPQTPIVIGASEIAHRDGPDFQPASATELMIEAVQRALESTGAGEVLGTLTGAVLVPHGTWTESDPGRAIAEAIGAPKARTIRSELGVLQQSLLARAATDVRSGAIDVAIVVGGENRWSGVVAGKAGTDLPEAPALACAAEPDEVIAPREMVISQIEIDRNLTTAAHQYAIIESALRHHLGRSTGAHQRELGELWARFAEIAAEAPAGWDTRAMKSDEIAFPSESNRMIAAPYPKWLISQWNVDQAAALIFTTVGTASRLGLDESTWVFPLAMVESNAVIPLPERADVHRWPASQLVSRAALEASGISIDEVGPVDLYSCFPSAVEVQAREIGLSIDRDLTLTGGMTFGGGPFNNYALQGAAAMVRKLRESPDPTFGLTSAVSGLLTKPAVTVWSNREPRTPFVSLDVSAQAEEATARRPVDPDLTGAGVVVGATVIPGRGGELTTVALVEVEGIRTVVQSQDQALGETFMAADAVGLPVIIGDPGEFTLA
jgi:acetyl-CoA C-acetyltransferase